MTDHTDRIDIDKELLRLEKDLDVRWRELEHIAGEVRMWIVRFRKLKTGGWPFDPTGTDTVSDILQLVYDELFFRRLQAWHALREKTEKPTRDIEL